VPLGGSEAAFVLDLSTSFHCDIAARLLALPAAAFAACAPELEDGSAFTRTMAANNKLARGVAVVGVVVDVY